MQTKLLIAVAAATMTLGLGACGQSAEKSGEKMDNAVENATQGHRNTSDGPLEQAGENVDRATGKQREGDAADAVNDATDGNPNTKP
ncbi:MAG: hypothetical protein ABUS57_03120 [Pseudomonadota bacterium]